MNNNIKYIKPYPGHLRFQADGFRNLNWTEKTEINYKKQEINR